MKPKLILQAFAWGAGLFALSIISQVWQNHPIDWLVTLAWSVGIPFVGAIAQSVSDRLQSLEFRVRYLERQAGIERCDED